MQTVYGNLTVEAVQEAYEKTGMKPTFGLWMHVDRGVCYGCALTAYLKHKKGTLPEKLETVSYADELGVDIKIIQNFIDGFDGPSTEPGKSSTFYLGCEVRRAVFKDLLKEKTS